MTEKSERIVGIALFTAVSVFTLWYVDYFGYSEIGITGFGKTPYGYGSFVYKILDEIFGNDFYTHRRTNLYWVVTQFVPLVVSWPMRKRLGYVARYLLRIAHNVYDAI